MEYCWLVVAARAALTLRSAQGSTPTASWRFFGAEQRTSC